ncbi:hypothetical protein [Microcystis phage Mwe-JY26]
MDDLSNDLDLIDRLDIEAEREFWEAEEAREWLAEQEAARLEMEG